MVNPMKIAAAVVVLGAAGAGAADWYLMHQAETMARDGLARFTATGLPPGSTLTTGDIAVAPFGRKVTLRDLKGVIKLPAQVIPVASAGQSAGLPGLPPPISGQSITIPAQDATFSIAEVAIIPRLDGQHFDGTASGLTYDLAAPKAHATIAQIQAEGLDGTALDHYKYGDQIGAEHERMDTLAVEIADMGSVSLASAEARDIVGGSIGQMSLDGLTAHLTLGPAKIEESVRHVGVEGFSLGASPQALAHDPQAMLAQARDLFGIKSLAIDDLSATAPDAQGGKITLGRLHLDDVRHDSGKSLALSFGLEDLAVQTPQAKVGLKTFAIAGLAVPIDPAEYQTQEKLSQYLMNGFGIKGMTVENLSVAGEIGNLSLESLLMKDITHKNGVITGGSESLTHLVVPLDQMPDPRFWGLGEIVGPTVENLLGKSLDLSFGAVSASDPDTGHVEFGPVTVDIARLISARLSGTLENVKPNTGPLALPPEQQARSGLDEFGRYQMKDVTVSLTDLGLVRGMIADQAKAAGAPPQMLAANLATMVRAELAPVFGPARAAAVAGALQSWLAGDKPTLSVTASAPQPIAFATLSSGQPVPDDVAVTAEAR
ncbi:hypothetical protein [Telmatospirillum sp.]|uniref:hypothetical protein n=1 Tax=Telmatospirillum sp. TaxID=2079197 RepID=UPI00283F31DD|nr:hypothetical protein [Telmatospirillum sp.]MDR3438374.1 hypothetical protein [Telmatospirillum sp.]